MRNLFLCLLIISSLYSCRWLSSSNTKAIEVVGPIPSSEKAALIWKEYHDSIPLDKYLKEGIQEQCRLEFFLLKQRRLKV